MKTLLLACIGAFCAAFGFAFSATAADTYTWTATGDGVGSASYVKILDDVGAFNGRLRLVGFSTAEGEYTVTSNRVHELASASSAIGALPAGSYVYQMSCGARYDGVTTKSIRVQLAQPSGSTALYARITAIATANGDHTAVPDLRVAINDDHTVDGSTSTAAADLLANAVTKIVVGVSNETIAYWPFGENGFSDVSGNGHDFTGVEIAESDAGYVSLNQGSATTQYLKTAAPIDLSKETAVTIECWCRQTARPSGVYGVLFSTPEPWVGTGGVILYSVGIFQAQTRTSDKGWHIDGSYTNSATTVSQALAADYVDGAWHHVAYVIDRSRVNDHYACRLYIDGVLQRNVGTSGGAPYTVPALFNDYFQIGNCLGYVVGKSYYSGYIDDVRISRGVVAPADFLKYPTVGKAMRADDGKLPVVAYWPFGGKVGKDATGNGFDLTMDATVPMISGTPNTVWGNRAEYTNFYLTSFPFSPFSKIGVTIECFAKSDSGSTSAGNILGLTSQYFNNPGAFRFSYEANFKTAGITFRLPTSSKYASSKTTEEQFGALNDAKWRHFAAVYDPSKTGAEMIKFYVDGVAAPSSSDVADQTAFALKDAMLYFSRTAKENGAFYGQFDDVRITAGVLTPDKFLASRSADSIVALYRFDHESFADASGNGNELLHCRAENVNGSGTPSFGVGTDDPVSGPGLLLTGKSGNKDWIRTANPVDLSGTKNMTIEIDYNNGHPQNTDGSSVHVLFASTNATTQKGGFVAYRNGNSVNGQLRQDASGWLSVLGAGLQSMTDVCPNGYRRCRYVINATKAGSLVTTLNLDGTAYSHTKSATFDSLGSLVLSFGHCPTYYGYASTDPCYLKGKILRVAVSDVAMDSTDYVLDNLPPDPETKATLAYWNFNGFSDKSGAGNDLVPSSGCQQRRGALLLDGASSAETEDTLYLAGLTQATIECFVCFGETPSSGTLFSLGSGVGSFAVAADATAGTLTGSFIPYDHLAASNGGASELATLAGKPKNMAAWHHVALVIDRTKSGADAVRFYVDYERAMPAGRAWDAAAAMLDGTLVVGAGFTGYIDDLRVSKGALATSEFLQPSEHTYVPDGMSILIR